MKNSDESNVYNFNYKERGIALLIHNEHFKKLPPRPGDDTDRKHMKKVFKSMGFKVCSFKNLKKSQMLQLADDIAKDNTHIDADCFVCVVASHGKEIQIDTGVHSKSHDREHVIMGSDDRYMKTSDFIKKFDDDHCKNLQGKPKFFFLQACRISMYKDKDGLDRGVFKMDEGFLVNKPQGTQQKSTNKKGGEYTVDGAVDDEMLLSHVSAKADGSKEELLTDMDDGCLSSDTDDDEDFDVLKARYQQSAFEHSSVGITTGGKEDVDAYGSNPDEQEKKTDMVPMATAVPCPEDTLIMFASLSGNFAVRSSFSGGWLLNKLYQSLKTYAEQPDELEKINFLDILTEVLTCMSTMTFYNPDTFYLNGQFSPGCFIHCLKSNVYFTKKASKRKKLSLLLQTMKKRLLD